MGLICTDIIKYYTNIEFVAHLLLLIIIIDIFFNLSTLTKFETHLIIIITILTCISFFLWDSTYTIYSYIGIIPVIWALKTIPLVKIKKYLFLILTINLIIAFYEYYNLSYLYEAVAFRNGDTKLLSFQEISGNVIRAKGIFAGPLTLANFAVGLCIIFRKEKYIYIISILICLLCNARLGLLCLTLIFFLDYWSFTIKKTVILVATLISLVLFANYFLDELGLLRISNVFDLQSNNHTMRLYFMNSAVILFLDYNLLEIFLETVVLY